MTFTSTRAGTVSCLYKEAVSDVPTAHHMHWRKSFLSIVLNYIHGTEVTF